MRLSKRRRRVVYQAFDRQLSFQTIVLGNSMVSKNNESQIACTNTLFQPTTLP